MSGFRNPFKQHHTVRKTALSKTAEREFERELKKVEQLEEDTKKIYKGVKRTVECQTGQIKAENKLVQEMYNSNLSKEEPRLHVIMDAWFQNTQQLDLLGQEANSTSCKTVVEPMKKLGSVFPSLQQSLKKREQMLQEYSKTQMKLDKYTERDRTGQNLVKLDTSKKEHSKAKADFDAVNGPLVEDIPKLYEGRLNYFQPCLKSLIMSELKYLTEAHKCYTMLSSTISPQTDVEEPTPFDSEEDDTDHTDMGRLQQKLTEIRNLAITVDD